MTEDTQDDALYIKGRIEALQARLARAETEWAGKPIEDRIKAAEFEGAKAAVCDARGRKARQAESPNGALYWVKRRESYLQMARILLSPQLVAGNLYGQVSEERDAIAAAQFWCEVANYPYAYQNLDWLGTNGAAYPSLTRSSRVQVNGMLLSGYVSCAATWSNKDPRYDAVIQAWHGTGRGGRVVARAPVQLHTIADAKLWVARNLPHIEEKIDGC